MSTARFCAIVEACHPEPNARDLSISSRSHKLDYVPVPARSLIVYAIRDDRIARAPFQSHSSNKNLAMSRDAVGRPIFAILALH